MLDLVKMLEQLKIDDNRKNRTVSEKVMQWKSLSFLSNKETEYQQHEQCKGKTIFLC